MQTCQESWYSQIILNFRNLVVLSCEKFFTAWFYRNWFGGIIWKDYGILFWIFDILKGKVKVVHPLSNFIRMDKPLTVSESIHDTDRIPYRCFLPDLTRFETVCCAAADQSDS